MALAMKTCMLVWISAAFVVGCSRGMSPSVSGSEIFDGFETNTTFGLHMDEPVDALLKSGAGFGDATACRYGRTMLRMDVSKVCLRSTYGFMLKQVLVGKAEHEIRLVEFVKPLGKCQPDVARKAYEALCIRIDRSLSRSLDVGCIGGDEIERRVWMLKAGETLCQYNSFLCRDDTGGWYLKVSILGEMRDK